MREKKRWPNLPKAPDSAFRLKEYLLTIDHKGVATRSDLLKIAGSSTELNSWLRDLVKRFELLEEIHGIAFDPIRFRHSWVRVPIFRLSAGRGFRVRAFARLTSDR